MRRHSHTTTTVHPAFTSRALSRASRARLRANLSCQKAECVLGREGEQWGQRCQKHPCTKMATRRPGKHTSGRPGAFFQWSR